MLNIILTVILTILSVIVCSGMVLAWLKISKIYADFKQFITPVKENEPSPAAIILDNIARNTGKAAADEIKTTLMGKSSGDSRLMKAVEGDIAQDMLTRDSPILAGLSQAFPTLGKRLRKNPVLAQTLANVAQKVIAGKNGSSAVQETISNDYGSRLNKYG